MCDEVPEGLAMIASGADLARHFDGFDRARVPGHGAFRFAIR